jgi:hypothetical protein
MAKMAAPREKTSQNKGDKMAAPLDKASQNKGDKMAAPTQLRREIDQVNFGVKLKPNWGNSARNFRIKGTKRQV